MTVCIAARSGQNIILASDRLLTAGDIQFEPNRAKILSLTTSISVMTAGDASFLTLVLTDLNGWIQRELNERPDQWIIVQHVVEWYVQFFSKWRNKMAEAAVLYPLGLTMESFLERQASMSPDVVRRLNGALLEYEAPGCSVIIAGRDPGGTFIYTVHGTDINEHETIGFAAVGMGARHAESQFMAFKHAWHAPPYETLFRTYVAKRRAEVAPGVGGATDMVIIGPGLGATFVVPEHILEQLEAEYSKLVAAEQRALEDAQARVAQLMSGLSSQPTPASGQAAVPAETASDPEPSALPDPLADSDQASPEE